MSNNNVMKIWNKDEENQLIEEINSLVDINLIVTKHQRTIGGVRARIKKIIENTNLNSKLNNLSEIVKKYFSADLEKDELFKKLLMNIKSNILSSKSINEISINNKITENQTKKILINLLNKENDIIIKEKITKLLSINFDENELYEKILDFNSISDIVNKYNEIKETKLVIILKKFLKKENIEVIKKERIKYILKNNFDNNYDNNYDNNFDNNTESNKTENYLLIKAITNFHNELKDIKSELFDIRNRIKVVSDKIDESNIIKINKSKKY